MFCFLKFGNIVGVIVWLGMIMCNVKVCVICDGVVIVDGFVIELLCCFKDDVMEVCIDYEVGIGFGKYNDI